MTVLTRGEDDRLRLLSIQRLGLLAPELAREALEFGTIEVEPDVLTWHGSLGEVHGHLVVLWLDPDLCSRVLGAPSVVDSLTAAVASVVARDSGNALAELKILPRSTPRPPIAPYRGRL